MAGAPPVRPDSELVGPQDLRGELPGHRRAHWEPVGSKELPAKAGRGSS
jgi:hypothetical protein